MIINQKKYSFRSAFSMLELVFVIVILGIIASISSSVIVQVYQSYIPQKAAAAAAAKTELAAVQIANRLASAVPWSIVAKNPAAPFTDFRLLSDIALADTGEKYTALEWIGVDNDGFNTGVWSGFCNTATATQTSCTSNGSAFLTANTIISNLSNGEVGLNGTAQQPVVIFKTNANSFTSTPLVQYSPACMGMTSPANTSCAIQATAATETGLIMPAGLKAISEHFVLAWSAYALVPEDCADRNGDGVSECDLNLYYNYQPWEGEQYTSNGVSRVTLLNNVTVFKFSQYDAAIRFKICVQQSIGNNANTPPVTLCKEKVVIR